MNDFQWEHTRIKRNRNEILSSLSLLPHTHRMSITNIAYAINWKAKYPRLLHCLATFICKNGWHSQQYENEDGKYTLYWKDRCDIATL